MVMKVFGVNYFGWKMASLLAIVAAIPAFYVLMRLAFGARPAVFATVFLCRLSLPLRVCTHRL